MYQDFTLLYHGHGRRRRRCLDRGRRKRWTHFLFIRILCFVLTVLCLLPGSLEHDTAGSRQFPLDPSRTNDGVGSVSVGRDALLAFLPLVPLCPILCRFRFGYCVPFSLSGLELSLLLFLQAASALSPLHDMR